MSLTFGTHTLIRCFFNPNRFLIFRSFKRIDSVTSLDLTSGNFQKQFFQIVKNSLNFQSVFVTCKSLSLTRRLGSSANASKQHSAIHKHALISLLF